MEKRQNMIELEGLVIEAHPAGFFRVLLDNKKTVLAYISGNIRQNSIRILVGDRVKIELHVCDLTKGRIIHRFRKS